MKGIITGYSVAYIMALLPSPHLKKNPFKVFVVVVVVVAKPCAVEESSNIEIIVSCKAE